MKYNKLFTYSSQSNCIQKREVAVLEDFTVYSRMLPKQALPYLAKELSAIGRKYNYNRVNPYKFDTTTDRHVYIAYGEMNNTSRYEIKNKMIVRVSNRKNFRIPEGTFLYDVLDYFVEIGLLNNKYEFIGELDESINIGTVDLFDAEYLKQNGFKFPKKLEFKLSHVVSATN